MRAFNKAKQYTPKIYGIEYGKVASPLLTRTGASLELLTANVGVASTKAINLFNGAEIYRDIHEVTDEFGNVFIRIPKFYIKKTDSATSYTVQISKQKFPESYLPWCFWNFTTNSENQYFDIGKYIASHTGTLLESKSNTFRPAFIHATTARTYALNNGTNYQLFDIHIYDVLISLFIVEFATLNSQSVMFGPSNIGYSQATVTESSVTRIILSNANADKYRVGHIISVGTTSLGYDIAQLRELLSITEYDASNKALNLSGAAFNVNIGYYAGLSGTKNGFSSGISDLSGSIVSNSDGYSENMYRGIENFYGRSLESIDGLNLNTDELWVTNNAANYAFGVFANPYVRLNYDRNSSTGYTTSRGFDSTYPFAEMNTVNTASGSTYFCDNSGRATGTRIMSWGGSHVYSDNSGIFYYNNALGTTSVGLLFEHRLCKKQK